MSTAHASQAFLNDLNTGTTWGAIYALAMYHAFDSPPKILIREVLERMGTPSKLLRVIQTVLEHGSTYISLDEIYQTTHGVKQGCPLSCFLFVLVFEIPLKYLQSQGLTISAYVDDVSTPISHGKGTRISYRISGAAGVKPDWLPTQRCQERMSTPPAPPSTASLATQVRSTP